MRNPCSLFLLLLLWGCAEENIGIPHPPATIDYPVAVAADPSGQYVWVTSGNFDLAYTGAAVLAIDVVTHEFKTDNDGHHAGFEIGNFPGPLHIVGGEQEVTRGYIASRADDRVYTLDLADANGNLVIGCQGGVTREDGLTACGEDASVGDGSYLDGAGEVVEGAVGNDPFGVFVHRAQPGADQDLLFVSSMVDGRLSVFGLGGTGTPTLLTEAQLSGGLISFAESPVTGRIYAAHKSINAIDELQVVYPSASDLDPTLYDQPEIVRTRSITVPSSLVEDYARSLAVSSDGTRLYAAYRSPSSVVVMALGTGPEGEAQANPVGRIPVGLGASDIVVVPPTETEPERVYVSSFRDDQIDVIDPVSGTVIDSIRTGRGPYGMTLVDAPELGIKRLYVANFYAQTVGVIELDPSSPYYHTQFVEIR